MHCTAQPNQRAHASLQHCLHFLPFPGEALLALKSAVSTNGWGSSKIRSWKSKGMGRPARGRGARRGARGRRRARAAVGMVGINSYGKCAACPQSGCTVTRACRRALHTETVGTPDLPGGPRDRPVSAAACHWSAQRRPLCLQPPAASKAKAGPAHHVLLHARPARRTLSNLGIQATLPLKLRQLNALQTLSLDGNR